MAKRIRRDDLPQREKQRIVRKCVADNRELAMALLLHGESEGSLLLRKKYYIRFVLVVVGILLIFAGIFVAMALIGSEVEFNDFNSYQLVVFLCMVGYEALIITAVMVLAFSGRRLIDKNMLYVMESGDDETEQTEWDDIVD